MAIKIQVTNATIALDDIGEGSPVLLLHGFPATRALWSRVVPLLGNSGYRLLVPDLALHWIVRWRLPWSCAISYRSPALPGQSGQNGDYAVFAEDHKGLLPIDDLVTHLYFHFVGTRGDVEHLWMIAGRRFLSSLQSIDEYDRTTRGAGHDDLGRVR